MSVKLFKVLLGLAIVLLTVISSAHPAEQTLPQQNSSEIQTAPPDIIHPDPVPEISVPPIVELDKDRIQVGNVLINKKDRSVSIKGQVNMASGLVEYVACTFYGKLHESILALDAEPFHIQVGLLLLGVSPGNHPIDFQGSVQKPCGDPVKITVSWQKNGHEVVYPLEEILFHMENQTTMEQSDWVFTGSQFAGGQYMAQVEGSIIATFHDPMAIIDNRSDTGSDDTMYHANHTLLPPVSTPVTLKIYPVTDPKILARTRCMDTDN